MKAINIRILEWIGILCVPLTVAAFLAVTDWFAPAPFDSTDAPPLRSGMRLYTDHGTGCEYLGTPFGGLTPRLNATGRPNGCGGMR